MVVLDKVKLLEHETVFFYASEMDARICYVMDQAGIPHIEMPVHRLRMRKKQSVMGLG